MQLPLLAKDHKVGDMRVRFKGLFEPEETPTGDRRMFKAGGLTNRDLPLPLMMRSTSGGHDGAETVAKIEKIERGPGGRWYFGTMLDPQMIPEVVKAIYLIENKMVGPSVDLDRTFTVEPRDWKDGKKVAYFTNGNVIGATLVPMPAFAEATIQLEYDNDDEKALVASLIQEFAREFAISGTGWDSLPVAPRDFVFDADDAVKRIAAWAGVGSGRPDTNRYASMFLWRGGNQVGDTMAQQDFRLPIGDILEGRPHLVYHAIYAAAALLSGAHGGLPNIPDQEKTALKRVINQIYPKMARAFNDPTMKSPFAGEGQMSMTDLDEFAGARSYADMNLMINGEPHAIDTPEAIKTAWEWINDESNTRDMPDEQVAIFRQRIKTAAKKAGVEIEEEAEETEESFADKGKLAEPFGDVKYADPGFRGDKKRYPIDTPEHIRAAWSYINVAKNAAEYTAEQLEQIKNRIKAAAKEAGIEISEDSEMALQAEVSFSFGPATPKAWFQNPNLVAPTPLTVTDDGRVFGHLGKWGQCHIGIGDKCVLLPKSRTDYQLFHVGNALCDDGTMERVGKITLGTGHAHPQYGIVPSRDHYDNTGWCAAVVRAGEDKFGVWVAGAVTDRSKIAELRRSPLSGDWRRFNGNLELVAALAVNNPGFPVFHSEGGEEFSLVAAGVVQFATGGLEDRDIYEEPPGAFTILDYEEVEAEVRAQVLAEQERARRFNQLQDERFEREQERRRERLAGITASARSSVLASITFAQEAEDEVDPDDPDADPETPGIPAIHDPGRDTMAARQRDARYRVIPDPPEDKETKETVEETETVVEEAPVAAQG